MKKFSYLFFTLILLFGISLITNSQSSNLFSDVGDGSDGDLTITAPNIINKYSYLINNELNGDNVIEVDDGSLFAVNNLLLIIQMQTFDGGTSGIHEVVRIQSISGNQITLSSPLVNSYYSGVFDTLEATSSQVVSIPQYSTLTVNSGASIVAKDWDGYSGGIVVFKANIGVVINGKIEANSKGYRGGNKSPVYPQHGAQGESFKGIGLNSRVANYGGGGWGAQSSYASGGNGAHGGGGAGHKMAGETGTVSTGSPVPDTEGGIYYSNILGTELTLGSGGGSGSDDSYAQIWAQGGNGGGIVIISTPSINNNGTIEAKGGTGQSGNSGKLSGAGGGAGGYILIHSNSAIGTFNVDGGTGGTPSCCGRGTGGAGSEGYVVIKPLSAQIQIFSISQTQINLSWADESNESSYAIERADSVNGTFVLVGTNNANDTVFQDLSGLVAATNYCYRVASVDSLGVYGPYSSVVCAETFPNPPAGASNLTSVTISQSTIELNWTDNATNEDGFVIYRALSGGSFSVIDTMAKDETNYLDSTLAVNSTYSYKVVAYNLGGDAPSSNISTSTTFDHPPVKVGSPSATAVTSIQIDLSWIDLATNETSYVVKRSTSSNGVYSAIATLSVNSSSYSDRYQLQPGTEYFYVVVGTNSGGETVSDTVSSTTLVTSAYSLNNGAIKCDDPGFCMVLKSNDSIVEGTGFDFTVGFDTSRYEFAGIIVFNDLIDPIYAEYATHANPDASLNVSLYIKGSAPSGTYFNGIDELFCLNFTKLSSGGAGSDTIIVSTIKESYLTQTRLHSGATGIVFIEENVPQGMLLSWNNMQPLSYDTTNPSAYLPSKIRGTNDTCGSRSSGFIYPNLNGYFEHDASSGSYIDIERDVLPTTLVMPFINGYDALLAKWITLGNPSFVPNVNQIIAADVNLDGEVTAGDVTLLNQRTTHKLTEFPQAGGGTSKDWLFVDSVSTTANNFVISSTYPSDDGMGYSKTRVPSINSCLDIYASNNGSCPSYEFTKYYGVYLGDVNGNFQQNNGNQYLNKKDGDSHLIFEISNTRRIDECTVDIPFKASSIDDIYSVDFQMDFDVRSLVHDKKHKGLILRKLRQKKL